MYCVNVTAPAYPFRYDGARDPVVSLSARETTVLQLHQTEKGGSEEGGGPDHRL